MIKKTIFSFMFIGFVLLAANNVFAKDITLAWDNSDDPSVTGYRVYYKINSSSLPFDGAGASEGGSPIDIGNKLTATLSNLREDQIVYFAVTAYNASGEESSFSNVVASEWIPEIFAPGNGEAIGDGQVTFSWAPAPTGSNVTYTVYYGTDPHLTPPALASYSFQNNAVLAGAVIFGLLGAAIPLRRQRQAAIVLILAGTLLIFSGCGGGGGGSDSDPVAPINVGDNNGSDTPATAENTSAVAGITETSYTAASLQSNTTYYWKVVAVDASGARRESETRSFTTGSF